MWSVLKPPPICCLVSIGLLISGTILISAGEETLRKLTAEDSDGQDSRFDKESDEELASSDRFEWKWPEDTTPTLNISSSPMVNQNVSSTTTTRRSSSSETTPFPVSRSTSSITLPDLEGAEEDVYEADETERVPGMNRRTFHELDINVGRNKESWFNRIKNLFKPNSRTSVLGHAMQGGAQFKEKYGSSNIGVGQQSSYGDGYSTGTNYQSGPQLVPDGAFAPIYKPTVSLALTADFIELNCAAHGRIQHGIRWVKLVGLNNYGHQLFATVADGDRILFDNYHFGVRTDGRKSRLIIRSPDPKIHYGVYQCQATVAGNPSLIVKEDFVVGKVK